MGDNLLRPAFGNKDLGRIAANVEEALPTLAPVLDMVFGLRPAAKEGHDASWWAHQRPRPYRGPTADPSGPAKEREEYMQKFEMEKRRLERLQRDRVKAEKEEARAAAEESRGIFEAKAGVEAEMNRIAFFGRPVQKARLLKRERQLERNDREQQAATFQHLMEDSLAEIDFQNKRIREQSSIRAKAVAAAANYRAQERGAVAAATGLSIGGNQLANAKLKAAIAAEAYCEKSEEQEEMARTAANEVADAEEILTQEEEKVRACQSQIIYNRSEAKTLIEDCYKIECREIRDLVEEELLLKKFVSDTLARERTVAKGGPAWQEIQKQLKQLRSRLAVVFMEKSMFVPNFTQFGKDANPFDYQLPSSTNPAKIEFEMVNLPKKKDFIWVLGKQKPGMVALGKGLLGPLTARHKVVKRRGQGEYADDPVLEHLPELPLSDLFEASKEPGVHNAADPVQLRTDFMGQDGIAMFLNRKMFEAGETDPHTVLDKEIFQKIWDQDWRHQVAISMLACSVKLRYPPPVLWTAGFVNGSKEKPNKFLLSKSSMGGLKSKPISLTLGPERKPFENVIIPGMHEEDLPENITGPDGQPRLIGTVFQWLKKYGDSVKEDDVIVLIEVENVREMVGMKRSLYVPPDKNRKHREKYQVDANGDKYRQNADGTNQNRYLLMVKAPSSGTLVGLMPEEGSKVESFLVLAFVDMGAKDWDKSLLPVTEWLSA